MANISRYFKLNRRGESQAHVVYAVTFTIIAVVALVGLIMVNTEADNSQQSTTIQNEAPSISAIQYGVSGISSVTSLNLGNVGGDPVVSAEGDRFTHVVTATVTDNNGCSDIDTAATNYDLRIFHRVADNNDGQACNSTNGTNCYFGDTASLTLGSCQDSTSYNLTWHVTGNYFLDATEADSLGWSARLQVTDDASAVTTSTDAFDVQTMLALDVNATTDFGTLAVGGHSDQVALSVKHTGNADVEDYKVGYNQPMQCTFNQFAGNNVKITQSSGAAYDGAVTAMGAAGAETTVDASIAKATSMATSATDPLYAFILIPANAGVRGNCSNTATYTAIANDAVGI